MSCKRVLYNEFSNKHKLKVVDYLNKSYGWEPVFMAGHQPTQEVTEWKSKNNYSCIIKDSMDLRKGQFDYDQIGRPRPIDADIVNSLSKYELNYLGILPDPTGWNYGYDERKKFYFEILKYWNTVIHNTKPDILVSFVQPHTVACYSLYLLCKHYYKIDVVFLDPVSLLDSYYHMVGVSLDELYAPILKYYNSKL